MQTSYVQCKGIQCVLQRSLSLEIHTLAEYPALGNLPDMLLFIMNFRISSAQKTVLAMQMSDKMSHSPSASV